jgi:hypothetical protein
MESDKEVKENESSLFVRYRSEIDQAYKRAVREALLKHKQAGNSVIVERNGEMVILPADEIKLNQE